MKMKMLKLIKRTVSVVTVVALMGGTMLNVEARGDETAADTKVKYEAFTNYDNYKENDSSKKLIPECQTPGYVFGGWFTKSENEDKYTPIASMADEEAETVYAKFVPAQVLSVKCQNVAGTTEASTETTVKVISALDTLNYQSYGFEMDVVILDSEGNYADEVYIDDEFQLKKAYTSFKVYKDANKTEEAGTYEPNKLFGDAAKYFTTYGVKKIPQGSFGAIICIKPYWKTIDGTEVYGLTKYAHVEDGFVKEGYRYVNVPVNLREMTSGVAAGVLSVDYSKALAKDSTLEYVGVEGGRVFNEMAWADKGTSVKLVGNTSDISDKNVNDIYANIRFKVSESDANKVLTGFEFEVNDEDFSDKLENQTTPDVWNVLY